MLNFECTVNLLTLTYVFKFEKHIPYISKKPFTPSYKQHIRFELLFHLALLCASFPYSCHLILPIPSVLVP